ncbi:MAG TPA: hypothetical protein VMR29_01160, partial [Candidatus Binatia bacterium]|nr:hypothetical protein [Candidatus Binatia bacterium]
PDDPPLVRADRAYQIAAAHFYAHDLDTATAEFDAIAKDSSSPWHAIAPLVAARALVRHATLDAEENQVIAPDLERAAARVKALLDDPSARDIHAAARRLDGFIAVRLHSSERRRELGEALSHATTGADREQQLRDYLWLVGRTADDTAARDDLTDWMDTFQSASAEAFAHAVARWRENPSPAWLVLALVKCNATDGAAGELVEAAKRLGADDPGKVMADFHRLRWLAAAGRTDEARRELDQALDAPSPRMTGSARNQLRGLRLRLARSLDEFLRFAPRTPVAVSFEAVEPADAVGFDGTPLLARGATYFDRDSAFVLNRQLPLATLAKVARDQTLAAPLRRQVAIATWTRAIAIDRFEVARDLSSTIAALVPELATEVNASPAASPREQRFAAAYTLLRFPGLGPLIEAGQPRQTPLAQIDALRRNWWCGAPIVEPATGSGVRPSPPDSGAGIESQDVSWTTRLPFLTSAERERSVSEMRALAALPAAPNALAREVLEWSGSHPDDSRVPEALHLVVRATRYGCTDAQTTEYSRKAFERLHRRYPKSVWTKKTPHWF